MFLKLPGHATWLAGTTTNGWVVDAVQRETNGSVYQSTATDEMPLNISHGLTVRMNVPLAPVTIGI